MRKRPWKIVLYVVVLVVLTGQLVDTIETEEEFGDSEVDHVTTHSRRFHHTRYVIPDSVLKHNGHANANLENDHKVIKTVFRSKRKLSKTSSKKQWKKRKTLSRSGRTRTRKLLSDDDVEYNIGEVYALSTSMFQVIPAKAFQATHQPLSGEDQKDNLSTSMYQILPEKIVHIAEEYRVENLPYPKKETAIANMLMNDARTSTQVHALKAGDEREAVNTNTGKTLHECLKSSTSQVQPVPPRTEKYVKDPKNSNVLQFATLNTSQSETFSTMSIPLNITPPTVRNITSSTRPLDSVRNVSSMMPTTDDKKKESGIDKIVSGIVGSNLQSMLESIPTDIVRIETKFSIKNHNAQNATNKTNQPPAKYFLITNIEAEKGEAMRQIREKGEVKENIEKVIIVDTSLLNTKQTRNQTQPRQTNGTQMVNQTSPMQQYQVFVNQNPPRQQNPMQVPNPIERNPQNVAQAMNPMDQKQKNVTRIINQMYEKQKKSTSAGRIKKAIAKNMGILKVLVLLFVICICLVFAYTLLMRRKRNQNWFCSSSRKKERDNILTIDTGVGSTSYTYTTFDEGSDRSEARRNDSCLYEYNTFQNKNKKCTPRKSFSSFMNKTFKKSRAKKCPREDSSSSSVLYYNTSCEDESVHLCKDKREKPSCKPKRSEKSNHLKYKWEGSKRGKSKVCVKPVYYNTENNLVRGEGSLFKELYSAIDSNTKDVKSKHHRKSTSKPHRNERKSSSKKRRSSRQPSVKHRSVSKKKTDIDALVAKYCKDVVEENEKEVRCVNYTNSYRQPHDKRPKKNKKLTR